ncbi:hypothetical protein [Brevundimonas sp.]|uniref:hypothetical protein n=1 Tax=Brevundimonas sp. TaxID=1871086 RepID=UPI00356155A2
MSVTKPANLRKTMLSSGIGFIAGVGGVMGFYALGGDVEWNGGRAAAGGVGLVYLMTGLFALLGAAVPGLGARLLNVSDIEELLEQRALLMGSALWFIAFGVMLLCLAGAGPGGFVPDALAIAAVAVAFVSTVVVTLRQWRLYDELLRQLSWESSAFATTLILPVLILWGGAVQLGYVGSIDPVAVIALASAAILAGAVIATGRRGLLAQR